MHSKTDLYKLVVLGDGGVGKTALTLQLCLERFVESHDPTIEDQYRKQVVIDSYSSMLEILDTAGQEAYAVLRDQWIRDGEGFVLVYSITSQSSFSHIKQIHRQIQRVKESYAPSPFSDRTPITTANPNLPVPIMLVGNKSDQVAERQVPRQQGRSLAVELGCSFVETSAQHLVSVQAAFYDVVRVLRRQRQQPSNCSAATRGRKLAGVKRRTSQAATASSGRKRKPRLQCTMS